MRRVVLYMMASVDGFIAGPDGGLDWMISPDEERQAEGLEFFDTVDTALIGHRVYHDMVEYWPTSTDEAAEYVNGLTKLVISRTTENLTWNNATQVLVHSDRDIVDRVAQLRAAPGRDMVLFGGVRLAQSFVRLGLVDEYRLVVQPVALGEGQALFGDLETRLALTLTGVRTFSSGAVLTTYRR